MLKHDIFNQRFNGYKAVCIQVPPEYQTSPFAYGNHTDFEDEYPGVICYGNSDFNSLGGGTWFQTLINQFLYGFGDIQNILDGANPEYSTVSEYLRDYFPKMYDDRIYSIEDILKITEVLRELENADSISREMLFLDLLTLMTGKKYTCICIHGDSQGEWQEVYYPEDDYTKENIAYLEACYFNTGAEYEIYPVSSLDKKVEEDESVFCYIINDKVKERLAETYGCKPEEILVYNAGPTITTYTYEEL